MKNNSYLSQDKENFLIVSDGYTKLLNLKTNQETQILDHRLDKIVFSNENCLSGIYDEFTIFSYDIKNKKSTGELLMNLTKDDKIINISYCKDNFLIIFTKNGYIYHYKNGHVSTFNDIDHIYTTASIIYIDLSKDQSIFGILCQEYCFLIVNSTQIVHLPDIYFNNNNIKQIRFCPFDNNIFYLLSDDRLLKFKINIQQKCIVKLDEIEGIIIKDIEFNPDTKKILIINSLDISYIYFINKNKFLILLTKIRYPNVKFFCNYKVFYFNKKIVIKEYKDYLIKFELRSIDKKRTLIKNNMIKNYKTMVKLMNNQVIQYDHCIECHEIDYIKKIHIFLFLSKVPYFFNYFNGEKRDPLKFPLRKSIPNDKAIDQFIKFIYTDVYPDAMTILQNLDFFKEICDKLWYNKENQLKLWVDKIDSINKQYIV